MAASAEFVSTFFESNYLSNYLLSRIEFENEHFSRAEFLLQFGSLNHSEKVDFAHKHLLLYKLFPAFVEDRKSDNCARQYEINGTEYFNNDNFLQALENYTNCLALAESEILAAAAHAKRSVCLFKLGMHKPCLQEIYRALEKHHPSEELVSVLEAVALQERVENDNEPVPQIPAENLFIQCANDCVQIKDLAARKCVVATRDIEIGEIISVEEPYACAVFPNQRTYYCHHCLQLCYNLLPCDNCSQALFCDEECKEKAQKSYHKFECAILLTLNRELVTNNPSLLIALRTAFLGMNDYFHLNTFHSDRNCYRSDRYNEIYDLKPISESSALDTLHDAVLAAFIFELLWAQTSFFNTLSSLWCSKHEYRDKFKEILLLHLTANKFNAVKIYNYVKEPKLYETENYGFGLYSFFSLFKHSCCANVMKTFHGTKIVLRALNSIKKDQECFVNRYGLRYDAFPYDKRNHMLAVSNLPNCDCMACHTNWIPSVGDFAEICRNLEIEATTYDDFIKKVIASDINKAKRFLPSFITLLKNCEADEPKGNALCLKQLIAHCYVILGNKRML